MRPETLVSDVKVLGSTETLAAEIPYDDGGGKLLAATGVQGSGGTTGAAITGPAKIAASLEGTLTGRESQDSP